MKVGIIGFTGFVGSAFHRAFSKDARYETIGIGRENYSQHKGGSFRILVNCNGNSSKRLADSKWEKDWEMNVDATGRFLRDFPCDHYIHISTVEVYADKSDPGKCREDSAIDVGRLSNYGKSKYEAEQVAKRLSKSWLILRLAGMVGPGMKKGPAFDILNLGRLFLSEKSRLQFLHTDSVASISKELSEKGRWNEIFNVVGEGSIPLSEFAAIAGVELEESRGAVEEFNVPCDKLGKIAKVPSTLGTVKDFCREFKAGGGKA